MEIRPLWCHRLHWWLFLQPAGSQQVTAKSCTLWDRFTHRPFPDAETVKKKKNPSGKYLTVPSWSIYLFSNVIENNQSEVKLEKTHIVLPSTLALGIEINWLWCEVLVATLTRKNWISIPSIFTQKNSTKTEHLQFYLSSQSICRCCPKAPKPHRNWCNGR